MVTENNITSIDINGEAYKDDQFILASQAKHVFYVADLSRGPNWRVVQHVKHRSIWDITDDGLSDIDLLQHNSSSNFTLFVDLGNLQQINFLKSNGDVIPIVQPVSTAPQHVTEDSSFLNNDDEVEFSEEDDGSIEEYADEEIDAEIAERNAAADALPFNDLLGKDAIYQEVDKLKEELKKITDKDVQINIFEVKKPEESKGPWDYYKLRTTIPAEQAFRPMADGNCPIAK